MPKTVQRIQRRRELLEKALIELIDKRGYDAVTIQHIVERANTRSYRKLVSIRTAILPAFIAGRTARERSAAENDVGVPTP